LRADGEEVQIAARAFTEWYTGVGRYCALEALLYSLLCYAMLAYPETRPSRFLLWEAIPFSHATWMKHLPSRHQHPLACLSHPWPCFLTYFLNNLVPNPLKIFPQNNQQQL
jgi:hypothetical protein